MKNYVSLFKGVIDRLSLWLAGVGALAVLVMMVSMVMDAIARKIMKPIPGVFETSLGLMIVIMFLPQAFGQLQKTHVSLDIIISRLPLKLAAIIQGVGAVLGAIIFGLIAYVGWGKAWHATIVGEIYPGVISYPVWLFRWFIPLGLGVLVLQFISTAIDAFSKVVRNR